MTYSGTPSNDRYSLLTTGAAGSPVQLYGQAGNDSLTIVSDGAPMPTGHLLDGGEGKDKLSLISNKSATNASFSLNSMFGGDGADSINITAGVRGYDASVLANSLVGGEGKDKVSIRAKSDMGYGRILFNSIDMGEGDESLKLDASGVGESSRINMNDILLGEGKHKVALSIKSKNTNGSIDGNDIIAGSGDDSLSIKVKADGYARAVTNNVSLGDGKNKIQIGIDAKEGYARSSSSIVTGSGDDKLTIKVASKIDDANFRFNTLDLGDGSNSTKVQVSGEDVTVENNYFYNSEETEKIDLIAKAKDFGLIEDNTVFSGDGDLQLKWTLDGGSITRIADNIISLGAGVDDISLKSVKLRGNMIDGSGNAGGAGKNSISLLGDNKQGTRGYVDGSVILTDGDGDEVQLVSKASKNEASLNQNNIETLGDGAKVELIGDSIQVEAKWNTLTGGNGDQEFALKFKSKGGIDFARNELSGGAGGKDLITIEAKTKSGFDFYKNTIVAVGAESKIDLQVATSASSGSFYENEIMGGDGGTTIGLGLQSGRSTDFLENSITTGMGEDSIEVAIKQKVGPFDLEVSDNQLYSGGGNDEIDWSLENSKSEVNSYGNIIDAGSGDDSMNVSIKGDSILLSDNHFLSGADDDQLEVKLEAKGEVRVEYSEFNVGSGTDRLDILLKGATGDLIANTLSSGSGDAYLSLEVVIKEETDLTDHHFLTDDGNDVIMLDFNGTAGLSSSMIDTGGADDRIVFKDDRSPTGTLASNSINGGDGVDTLEFAGKGSEIELGAATYLTNIERIHLDGKGWRIADLDTDDVGSITDGDGLLFISGSKSEVELVGVWTDTTAVINAYDTTFREFVYGGNTVYLETGISIV